jgi:hypothetical protein
MTNETSNIKVTLTFEQFTLMREALIAGLSAANSIVRTNTDEHGVGNVMAKHNAEISAQIDAALAAGRPSKVKFS